MKKKSEKEKKLCVALITAMCHDRQISRLSLVSVSAELQLAAIASSIKEGADEALSVVLGENGAGSPETLEKCRESQGVVFTVRRNKDNVASVRRLQTNLEMIQAQVLGYIFVE